MDHQHGIVAAARDDRGLHAANRLIDGILHIVHSLVEPVHPRLVVGVPCGQQVRAIGRGIEIVDVVRHVVEDQLAPFARGEVEAIERITPGRLVVHDAVAKIAALVDAERVEAGVVVPLFGLHDRMERFRGVRAVDHRPAIAGPAEAGTDHALLVGIPVPDVGAGLNDLLLAIGRQIDGEYGRVVIDRALIGQQDRLPFGIDPENVIADQPFLPAADETGLAGRDVERHQPRLPGIVALPGHGFAHAQQDRAVSGPAIPVEIVIVPKGHDPGIVLADLDDSDAILARDIQPRDDLRAIGRELGIAEERLVGQHARLDAWRAGLRGRRGVRLCVERRQGRKHDRGCRPGKPAPVEHRIPRSERPVRPRMRRRKAPPSILFPRYISMK